MAYIVAIILTFGADSLYKKKISVRIKIIKWFITMWQSLLAKTYQVSVLSVITPFFLYGEVFSFVLRKVGNLIKTLP